MVKLTEKSVVCLLIIALATVSSVSSQCCDFYSYTCSWNTATWRTSYEYSPSLSPYPYFISSETDPYFMYIQDQPGYTISTSTFYIPGDGTIISFDYFLDSPIVDSDNYFYVEFYNSAASFSTWLLTVNTQSSTWQHAQIVCNYENNYCCGGSELVPCQGTLRIVANVDSTYPQALIAIDSIGTTCSSTPITVPPPTPNCCSFDANTCGSSGNWYWSEAFATPYIPPISGYFEWTSLNGALWYSAVQSGVSASTIFTLQYYVQSPNAQLSVNFREYTTGTSYPVTTLTYTGNAWRPFSFNCINCCGPYTTCDGELMITPYIPDGSEVAIDNVGRDYSCYGAYSCCLFDDPTLCGAQVIPDHGYQWQYSGTVSPYYVPYPGSPFVYFEIINSPYVLNVELVSNDQITINYDTVFRGNIYVTNPSYPTYINTLNINFHNTVNGVVVRLGSIESTSSTWEIIYFYCSAVNCCQGLSSCTGYIDFTAVVSEIGADVVYAVDAFEIQGSCGVFPGAKNSTQIGLQPKTA